MLFKVWPELNIEFLEGYTAPDFFLVIILVPCPETTAPGEYIGFSHRLHCLFMDNEAEQVHQITGLLQCLVEKEHK